MSERGPIEALRFVGTGYAAPLPESQGRFTIGAGGCDVVVPRAIAPAMATHHATVTRLPGTAALMVRERGVAVDVVARSGDMFWLAGVPVLATDARLEALRLPLGRSVGLAHHGAIDAAIEIVAAGHPLVLLGPSNLDSRSLAREIHGASPQRGRFWLNDESALSSLRGLCGGAVFVDLAEEKLTASIARVLFDRGRGLGVVFGAPDIATMSRALDSYRDRVQCVTLAPLSRRRDEVLPLLAMIWRDELRTHREVDELGPAVQGISSYAWPRNLTELREHAQRLLAYLEHGGLRGAARALGIAHQTLAAHLDRIGFVRVGQEVPSMPKPFGAPSVSGP